MKKLFILIAVLSLLFFSCPFSYENDEGFRFWAQNLTTESYYSVNAELLVEGSKCNVWAEKGSGVSKTTAQNLANIYDSRIYPRMIDVFSEKNFNFQDQSFSNIMDLADALVDGDGKLTILLLDIKDGYQQGVNDSYVQGYFWAGNFFSANQIDYSNQCDMIYIDNNPSNPDSKESYKTLAHEMQHLMNFTTTILRRSESNNNNELTNIFLMDTWIDEGLSASAEWVYSEEQSQDRINWYNNNGSLDNNGKKSMSGSIDEGNNFFVWDNRDKENKYAILDDYATVYLFFQWLRIQKDSTSIYKDIISSTKNNYMAVVDAINGYSNWQSLLEAWLAANKINNPSNQYGYKGQIAVNVTYAPESPVLKTIKLYPGEGVYSLTSTSSPTTNPSTNIVYKYITTTDVNPSHSSGSTLLTYNKNTVAYIYDSKGNITDFASPENGTITGIASSISASVSAVNDGRFAAAPFSGAFRIDAGDLLRRRRAERNFPIGNLSLQTEKNTEQKAALNDDE